MKFKRNKPKNTDLIVNEEDIHRSKHILVKLLRSILYEFRITYGQLTEKNKEFCEEQGIVSNKIITSSKNNMISVIKRDDNLTWATLEKILYIILGQGIISIQIKTMDIHDTSKKFTFKTEL